MKTMLSGRFLVAIVNAVMLLMTGAAMSGEEGILQPNVIIVHAPDAAVLGSNGAVFPEALGGATATARQAQLLSGRHEFACGVSHPFEGRNFIRPDVPLLPEAFRKAGYRTALAGDWLLGGALPCRPQDRGFQEVFAPAPEGSLEGGWGVAEGSQATLRMAEAYQWLANRAGDRMPFFLEVSWPSEEALSSLRAELRRIGLAGRTIVVAIGMGRAGVPFPQNTVTSLAIEGAGLTMEKIHRDPVSLMDVSATLAARCGLEWKSEGVDLGSVITGEGKLPAGRKFFLHAGGWPGEESPDRHKGQNFAVRDSRWMLAGLEWLDLQKPAGQRSNEFDQHADIATVWLAEYGRWWKRVSAGLQEPVRLIVGDPRQPVVRANASQWWPSREALKADGAAVCRDQQALLALLEKLADPAQAVALSSISGHWKLQVAEEGHYRVTLWKLPPEAAAEHRKRLGKLRAGKVHLRAGKFELQSDVRENATAVTVGMDFPAGPVEFEAWFDGQLAGDRILGVFFVSLERVGERKLPDPDWNVRPDSKNP